MTNSYGLVYFTLITSTLLFIVRERNVQKLFKSLYLLYFLCNNIYEIKYFYHSTNLCQFTESYPYKTLLQMPCK